MPAPGLPLRQGGRRLRRVLERLVAGTALVALAPAFVLIALLVKLDSRGPVFARQAHLGRNGRRYSIPKFRTRCAGGRPQLCAASAHDAGAASHHGPRLTRVGRFLQRAGLDELPALWSVLVGDLSLLGPRPVVAPEVAARWHRRRFGVRSGAASHWQKRRAGVPGTPGKVWQHTRTEE